MKSLSSPLYVLNFTTISSLRSFPIKYSSVNYLRLSISKGDKAVADLIVPYEVS